jgi:putative hemolysin
MKIRKVFLGIGLLGVVLTMAACRGANATETEVGLPNPASVNCEDQGGRLEMRQEEGGGTYGVCVFSDGSECEEWALFNKTCEPGMYDEAEGGMNMVNLVEEASLRDAIALDVYKLNFETSDEPYSPLLTIDDPAELELLIDALDVNIHPGPGLLCAPIYKLYFRFVDGGMEEFDYSCGEGEGTFLRGDQAYMAGGDFIPPTAFNEAMMGFVQSTWAESINPTAEYSLDKAVTMELFETVYTEPEGEPAVVTAEVVSLVKTKDTNAVAAMAAALNHDFSFTNSVRCSSSYTLQFTFDDMTTVSLGYLCHDEGLKLLRGDDGIWEGRAIEASEAFQSEFEVLLKKTEEVVDASSSIPGPEEISEWVGLIHSTDTGDQFDDYFERTDLGQLLYFGIESQDPEIAAQIVELRDSGKTVRVWGTLYSDALDYNGSQILVTRIEIVEQ